MSITKEQYKEQHDKITQQIEEARSRRTQCRIAYSEKTDEIVDYYVEHAGDMQDDEILVLKTEIYNRCTQYRTLYWTNLNVDADPTLQESMTEDNDDRTYQMNNLKVGFPKIGELDDFIVAWWNADHDITVYETQLKELNNQSIKEEEPVIDTATEIQETESKVEEQVETVTETESSDGHVYPVALVQGWTNEMKNYNDQLSQYMGLLMEINFDKVDRMWLKNQVIKFVTWLKGQLKKLREKIINGLKGMMQPIKKAMSLVSPILSLPSDPLAILGWAGNVVGVFTEPYTKIMQFISDFTTYTPPLISEAGKLAVNVATVPVKITVKVNELEGEGSDVIKEEIANAVSDVSFEPPSMGDIS